MTDHLKVQKAVYNNAIWCDTVCRAHGRPGEFQETVWLHRHEPLPFYPNIVTLTAKGTSTQLDYIHELINLGLPEAWGLKDSFCTLDLVPLGFRLLFEAQWLWRDGPKPDDDLPGVCWLQIQEASELAGWEKAWRGEPDNEVASSQPPMFPSALLADENIAFIAGYQEQQLIAGIIANRTGDVVGLSNLFLPAQDQARLRAGCVAAVMAAFPALPIVGYEAGDALTAFQALGFETLGPLRVWLRELLG